MAAKAEDLGWNVKALDQNEDDDQSFSEDFEPYSLTISKPEAPAGAIRLVTLNGLRNCFFSGSVCPIVQWGAETPRLETYGMCLTHWDDDLEFAPKAIEGSPRSVVRDHRRTVGVEVSLANWLLREDQGVVWGDPAFQCWMQRATPILILSIAQEVEGDDTVLFQGPPVRRYRAPGAEYPSPSEAAFKTLQELVFWIYKDENALETKHSLAVAEIARHDDGDGSPDHLWPAPIGWSGFSLSA